MSYTSVLLFPNNNSVVELQDHIVERLFGIVNANDLLEWMLLKVKQIWNVLKLKVAYGFLHHTKQTSGSLSLTESNFPQKYDIINHCNWFILLNTFHCVNKHIHLSKLKIKGLLCVSLFMRYEITWNINL